TNTLSLHASEPISSSAVTRSSTAYCSTRAVPSGCAPPTGTTSKQARLYSALEPIHSLQRSCCAPASALITVCPSATASRTTRRHRSRWPSSHTPLLKGAHNPVMGSVLRYTSGLAAAGPNDMQVVWFNAAGAAEESRAVALLSAAVMRV